MDKLTNAITVKLTDQVERQLRAIADHAGHGLSEYIRDLIDADIEKHHSLFRLYKEIFGEEDRTDKENRG